MSTDSCEWALKNGDLQQVESLLAEKKISDDQFTSGRLPLVIAADYGQTEVLKYLISNGFDVNKSDKNGITPLLAAIYESHTDCVKLLLEKGADREGKAPDGQSYEAVAESDDIKKLLQ